MFLAGFDQLGLNDPEFAVYAPAQDPIDMDYGFTSVVRLALIDLAQQWCDQCTAERESDPEIKFQIKRIKAEQT